MRNPLSFFSKKSTASVRLLTTVLQQCQTHNGHLISSLKVNSNNKHQMNALLKPLCLSRRDKKTLIDEHLLPLSVSPLTTNDVFTALKKEHHPAFPCQVCDNCALGLFEHYGYLVADAGWCSQCFKRGECLDVPLIEHYRKYGIDDDTIWRYLPRKRCLSDTYPLHLRYSTIEDIEACHQPLFDAFKAQKRLMELEGTKPKKPIKREHRRINASSNDTLRHRSLS